MKQKRKYWLVLRLYSWNSIIANGVPCSTPQGGPEHFSPIFIKKEDAVKCAGSEELVIPIYQK